MAAVLEEVLALPPTDRTSFQGHKGPSTGKSDTGRDYSKTESVIPDDSEGPAADPLLAEELN
jgi:hypothetical protein